MRIFNVEEEQRAENGQCPECGSYDIEFSEVDYSSRDFSLALDMHCNLCGLQWWEVYKYSGIEGK
jgi:DNA-directed RNA polymerase subunit M/transcription elongation factor TFIIS